MNTFFLATPPRGTTAPTAFGIFYSGRVVVRDDPPQVREQALRMDVNIFLQALGQAAS